jgi:hypothetical protein
VPEPDKPGVASVSISATETSQYRRTVEFIVEVSAYAEQVDDDGLRVIVEMLLNDLAEMAKR